MKKIFVSILFFVSQMSFAGDYEVWFVNGISNSPEDFEYSKLSLRMAINNYKPSGTTISITKDDVKGIYNPSNGTILGAGLTDIFRELPQIANLEENIRKEADKRFPSNKQRADAEYSRIMGLAMIKYMPTSFDPAYSGVYSKTLSVVADIVGQIENRLQLGKKIVIVAHSQGNHMVALAYAALIAKNSAYANSIRVVGVAPVAATTPNNRYATIDGDYTVQSLYKNVLGGNPLPSNISEVISSVFDKTRCSLLADILPGVKSVVTCFAANGHSFTDVYLNEFLLVKDTTISLQHHVASMVWSSLIELSQSQPVTFASLVTTPSYDLFTDDTYGQCYSKSVGSASGSNTYTMTESKYCLSGGQWVARTLGDTQILGDYGVLYPESSKILKDTGNNTYSVSYGSRAYLSGSFSQKATGVYTHTLTQTASMYYFNFNSNSYIYNNVSSLGALITNYNCANNSGYLSTGGQYGVMLCGSASDTNGITRYFAVGDSSRTIVDRGTWSKLSFSNGVALIGLGDNSTIVTGDSNITLAYLKMPSESGVREGGSIKIGRIQLWDSYNREAFDNLLRGKVLPLTVN